MVEVRIDVIFVIEYVVYNVRIYVISGIMVVSCGGVCCEI